MSAGSRLPLALGQDASRALMQLWCMPSDSVLVVGSVRRQCEDIGDLEFTARMPVDKSRDELHRSIAATIRQEGLFEATKPKTFGVAVEGFKPGFKYCSLLMTLERDGQQYELPVQIHRYAHGDSNRGWIEIMRTGPADFGEIFLSRWKKQHGIPREKPASVEGFLVDATGARVSVPSERVAFELCGLKYIEPHVREEVCRQLKRAGGGV